MPWLLKDRAFFARVFCVLVVAFVGATPSEAQLPRIAGGGTSVDVALSSQGGSVVDRALLAETADPSRDGVTTVSLNLREGPATSYARVALLGEGRDIQVLREDGEWLYVTASQNEGWVHSDYVRLVPGTEAPSAVALEFDRLKEAEASWSGERESLSRRILKLEEDREDLQQALRDLRGEVSFGGMKTAPESPSEERSEGRTAVKSRRELRDLQKKLDKLQSERSDLQVALDSAREESSRSRKSAELQVDDLKRELERAASELADLRQARTEPSESPELAAALKALKEQHESESQQLLGELTASEQARESLWASLGTVQRENGALRRQVESLGGSVPMAPTIAPELAVATESPEDLLTSRVAGWVGAWSDQSLDSYLDYYSSAFVPNRGMSVDAWRALRESRLSRPEFVRVSTGSVSVEFTEEGRATTTFEQSYESNRYSDRVNKRLDWVDEAGVWRIVAESSQPIR